MLEYEVLKPLFHFLGVLLLAKKQWSNIDGWVIAYFMYNKMKQNKCFKCLPILNTNL
jgi:hypothetical protein